MTRILLVEDNPADALYIHELLEDPTELSCQITHVKRLSSALDLLRQTGFDIALLDLSLPDSMGLNVIVQVQSTWPELPTIVLTGLDDSAMGVKAVRQGAQDYLVKGQFDRNLLIKAIRYAMERAANQRQMKRQAEAMSASSEGIALLTQDYVYFYVNQSYANLYGSESIDQLLGSPWVLLQLAPKISPSTQIIQAALETGSWKGEVSGVGFTGQPFEVDLSLTRFDRGSLICLARDIRDRKQVQFELQKALEKEREINQIKSNFMSMISHEFRTPMTGIQVATRLLEANCQITPEKRAEYFSRIQGSVNDMIQLLDELLLLDQAGKGGLRFEPAPLNLEYFCGELAGIVQFNSGNSHQVLFSCEGECSPAVMDKVLLKHILTNLLSNAIKYTPHSKPISFCLKGDGTTAKLEICDQGIGIAEDELDHLFEPFYRCNNVGQIKGTGLGLSIVKQCVHLHQGHIEVSSQLGTGTTFVVTLPLQPQQVCLTAED